MIAVNEGVSAYEEDFKPVFIEGAVERLTQMNGTLLSLEQDPRNQDLLDTLFRDAHTLKSGAMMVGFNDFAQVAHTLEDHLAEVRANPQLVTAPLVDLLLKTLNTLNDFLVANGAPAAPTGAAARSR
jgi:two-component system chemotaxis sensor kinase CheA